MSVFIVRLGDVVHGVYSALPLAIKVAYAVQQQDGIQPVSEEVPHGNHEVRRWHSARGHALVIEWREVMS